MSQHSGSGNAPIQSAEDSLRELLQLCGADPAACPTLAQLQKEARAFGLRRADRAGGRDSLIYRAGYAFDAIGWLEFDAHQAAGILTSADLVREIVTAYGDEPLDVPFSVLISLALMRPEIALWADQEGRRHEWKRLRALNERETSTFKASLEYQEPEKWRRRSPSRAQIYLISEIVRLTETADPQVTTRGEAFDFIDGAGGNPRYLRGPELLERPRFKP